MVQTLRTKRSQGRLMRVCSRSFLCKTYLTHMSKLWLNTKRLATIDGTKTDTDPTIGTDHREGIGRQAVDTDLRKEGTDRQAEGIHHTDPRVEAIDHPTEEVTDRRMGMGDRRAYHHRLSQGNRRHCVR